jgi:hypothetical protein
MCPVTNPFLCFDERFSQYAIRTEFIRSFPRSHRLSLSIFRPITITFDFLELNFKFHLLANLETVILIEFRLETHYEPLLYTLLLHTVAPYGSLPQFQVVETN